MRPESFTEESGGFVFTYNTEDLKKWITLGNKDGNVGSILLSYKDGFKRYASYGTIENPRKTRLTISIKHLAVFSGEFNVNSVMNPKPLFSSASYGVLIPTVNNKYKEWN